MRLLPVRVAGVPSAMADVASTIGPAETGTIEISLPDSSHVRVGNDVTLTALRRVISVLRG
jgi:citrate lyase gamma subunit